MTQLKYRKKIKMDRGLKLDLENNAERRHYYAKDLSQDPKIRPVKHYWNGFNKQGKEMWYIELNNGTLLSDSNKEYEFWSKRYYPNLV